MAYDGASYKEQLINRQKNKKNEKSKSIKQTKFYPVVTFVLYLGGKAWKKDKSLFEVLDIRPEFKPFVSDYKINIIDLSEISENQAKLFKSDFRSLIDWLKKQKNQDYEVAPRKLDHPAELKQLLYSMSGDERVLTVEDEYNDEGEGITMCEFIDRLEAIGEARGKIEGKIEGKVELLTNLVQDKILSLKEAAARVDMTVAKFKEVSQKLAATN